ncbi:hypothetical protein D9M71_400210 [compost metagenome]
MPIKLDWIDHNVGADSRKVYRSLTKIDQGNLGTPLATLAGSALTYTDNTVQRGVTYHYVVTSVVGEDEAPSAEYVIAYIPYTGPGPQNLLRGNWDFGYFGRVPLEDIFSAVELCSVLNMPATTSVEASTGNYWHKIVYKGKILFFPCNRIAYGATFAQLYQLGLVYGARPSSEWPAAIKTYLGTIAQNKIVSSHEHKFIVRLPTSRSDMLSTSTTVADLKGGEYDAVFACMWLNRDSNVDNLPAFDDTVATVQSGHYFLSADYYSGTGVNTFIVCRGPTSVALGNIDFLQPAYGINGQSSAVAWRPVLELVY